MKALLFSNTLQFQQGFPDPMPIPEEAIIRVRMAGICRTDIEIARGYMGFRGIPGHEFVGEVESAPDSEWIGKRVIGEINCGCGVCSLCGSGLERHCSRRSVLGILHRNGAFAEKLSLPVRNLHIVPSNIPDEEAVFTEPVAAAFEILEQLAPKSLEEKRVTVVGDGKLGLLTAQVLRNAGARIKVIGHYPERMAFLRSLDIETCHEKQISESDTFQSDLVVEASGSVTGFDLSQKLVRPRGILILKSTIASSEPMNLSFLVIQEITIIASRCGPFSPALAFLSSGKAKIAPLIEKIYPIDQAVEAFDHAGRPGAGKILIRM